MEHPVYDALRGAGFTPRDPRSQSAGHESNGHFVHLSARRKPRLGKVKIAAESGMHNLDHREDWRHIYYPGTSLVTWHHHGYLTGDGSLGSAALPTEPGYTGTPARVPGFRWAWVGPSWYWPAAVTGVAWLEDLSGEVEPVLAPFVVGGPFRLGWV